MLFFQTHRIPVLAAGLILVLSGCGIARHYQAQQSQADTPASGSNFYGGGMVCNATLLSEETDLSAPEAFSFFSYELPLISDHEIKDLTVSDIHVSGEGSEEEGYLIRPDGYTFGDVYQGWYYYYIHLKTAMAQDHPISLTVDSVDLMIDRHPYTYVPYDMRFFNTKGLYREYYTDDAEILFYHEPPVMIYSHVPDDPENPAQLVLEAGEDCTIRKFEASDFLDITNLTCKINGEEAVFQGDSLPVKKEDVIELNFNLSYREGLSDENLIKTSRILFCEDKEGKPFLFNEPQGFSIIGFENDEMIHNYIDRELSDE